MENMNAKDRLMEQIKEVLEEGDLEYDCSEKYVAVPFREFVVGMEPTDESLEMKLIEREEAEEEYLGELLRLLNNLNQMTKEGHWQLDEDKRVSFRIYVRLPENKTLKTQRISEILAKEFLAHKNFGQAIKRVTYGLSTAEEALEEALESLIG